MGRTHREHFKEAMGKFSAGKTPASPSGNQEEV